MNYRRLGKTGYRVSEIGIGTWQLGAKWGDKFDEQKAMDILEIAYASGVNIIDTADIYQDGQSEKAVGKFIKATKDPVYVVTKIGRKTSPHTMSNYSKTHLTDYVNACLDNLQVSALDMVLLHCPPSEIYSSKEVFDTLDNLKQQGKIIHYGVSVETVQEALDALKFDVSAIEIIFNMFRLKPRNLFFKEAIQKDVGLIARVPLASGLLTGKFDNNTVFEKADHRNFNRNGEAFDKGETFSGINYERGLVAVDKLKEVLGSDYLTQKALKFILMHPEVSTVIPGASSPGQVKSNLQTLELPALSEREMKVIEDIYDEYIRDDVEGLW